MRLSISSLAAALLRRIDDDFVFMRASSLTYQTFLAIVPLLAVMFGIAKGFGLDASFESILRHELADHKDVLDYLLSFSKSTLQQARGGVVAGVGVIFLLFTAMRLFSSIEQTFNAMWGILKPRKYVHRAVSYLALIAICPILLVVTSSMTLFLSTQLLTIIDSSFFSQISTIVHFGISLLPLVFLAVLFSTLLYIIPSAKVSYRSALASGFLAATLFQLVQIWYIRVQFDLTQISAIYGSFAALPLFLIWLWISWLIFLLAGEFSVACEERVWQYTFAELMLDKRACTIALMSIIMSEYERGKTVVTFDALSRQLNIPLKVFYSCLEWLKEKDLIYEAIDAHNVVTLIPSRSAFSYSLTDLIFNFESHSREKKPIFAAPHNASLPLHSAYRKLNEIIFQMENESFSMPKLFDETKTLQ